MKYSDNIFELIALAVNAKKKNPEWRWGQSVFNTARAWFLFGNVPDFVNPFNDDAKVDLFLQWLQEELDLKL